VGRGNARSRCWVRTPPRKIRHQFRGYKHTSLSILVVSCYELRRDGVLRSSAIMQNEGVAKGTDFLLLTPRRVLLSTFRRIALL
jgi:hypothetical protein